MFVQLAIGLLALMFHVLRRHQIPLMGFRIGLVCGIVPIECIMLTVVLFWLAMRDIGTTIAYLQRPKYTEMEKQEDIDT